MTGMTEEVMSRIAVNGILKKMQSKVIKLDEDELLKLEEYLLKIDKHFFKKGQK